MDVWKALVGMLALFLGAFLKKLKDDVGTEMVSKGAKPDRRENILPEIRSLEKNIISGVKNSFDCGFDKLEQYKFDQNMDETKKQTVLIERMVKLQNDTLVTLREIKEIRERGN